MRVTLYRETNEEILALAEQDLSDAFSSQLTTRLQTAPALRCHTDGSAEVSVLSEEKRITMLGSIENDEAIWAIGELPNGEGFLGILDRVEQKPESTTLTFSYGHPRWNHSLCRNTLFVAGITALTPRWLPQIFGRAKVHPVALFEGLRTRTRIFLEAGSTRLPLESTIGFPPSGTVQLLDELLVYTAISSTTNELLLSTPTSYAHNAQSAVIIIPPDGTFRWCVADHPSVVHRITIESDDGPLADSLAVVHTMLGGRDATLLEADRLPLMRRLSQSESTRFAGRREVDWSVLPESNAFFPERAFGERDDGGTASLTALQTILAARMIDDFPQSVDRFGERLDAALIVDITTPSQWPPLAMTLIQIRRGDAIAQRILHAASSGFPAQGFARVTIPLSDLWLDSTVEEFFRGVGPEVRVIYYPPDPADPLKVQVRRVRVSQRLIPARSVEPTDKIVADVSGRCSQPNGLANPIDSLDALLFHPDFTALPITRRDDLRMESLQFEADLRGWGVRAVFTDGATLGDGVKQLCGETLLRLQLREEGLAATMIRSPGPIPPTLLQPHNLDDGSLTVRYERQPRDTTPLDWRWLEAGRADILSTLGARWRRWREERAVLLLAGPIPRLGEFVATGLSNRTEEVTGLAANQMEQRLRIDGM